MKLRFRKLNQLGFDHVMVVVFIVVFGAIGGTYYVLSHANPWNGSGALKLGINNLCMTNMDNSKTAITTVQATTCNSTSPAQHWTVKTISGNNFEIIAGTSKACVSNYGGSVQTQYGVANRVFLSTQPCNQNSSDSTQELWHWSGSDFKGHQLVNVASGGCINYPTTNNSVQRLIMYTCSPSMGGAGTNSQWYVATNTAGSGSGGTSGSSGALNVTGAQLSVGPKGSKYCLDAPSVKQGAVVVLNPCNTSKAGQGWSFIAAGKIVGGGKTVQTYIVKNMTSGTNQCLDDWGQSITSSDAKNPVKLYTCKTSDRGQQFLWAGDNHQLRSVAALNHKPPVALCLDNSGGALKASNPVGFFTCKASNATNQDWYKQ